MTTITMNASSTADTQPDVVMPRELAEWYTGLLDDFASLVRKLRDR